MRVTERKKKNEKKTVTKYFCNQCEGLSHQMCPFGCSGGGGGGGGSGVMHAPSSLGGFKFRLVSTEANP